MVIDLTLVPATVCVDLSEVAFRRSAGLDERATSFATKAREVYLLRHAPPKACRVIDLGFFVSTSVGGSMDHFRSSTSQDSVAVQLPTVAVPWRSAANSGSAHRAPVSRLKAACSTTRASSQLTGAGGDGNA